MNKKWMQLRTDWHNSSQDAFEELVCQIAGAVESVPPGSKFYRVKAPDAGVECFWVTPSGKEWGWQAKFFDSVGKSQWNQLTDSFRTAVEKHPQLVKYIVALPLDREDARTKQKWLMDRWITWVRERQAEAANQGRSVEIEFFGNHEIMAELSLEKHRGRGRFFFGIEDRLGPSWFKSHLKDITLLAGERYTPACHIDLPIVEHFQSLGRTPAFLEKLSSLLLDAARSLNQAANATASTPVADRLQSTGRSVSSLMDIRDSLLRGGLDPLPLDRLREMTNDCISRVIDSTTTLRHVENEAKAAKRTSIAAQVHEDRQVADPPKEVHFGYQRQLLDKAQHTLFDVDAFLNGSDADLANGSVLLLVGEPGSGKTHLLCDVTRSRIVAGYPTILAFGVRFRSDQRPLIQLVQQLDLTFADEDEFLGALQAAAQSSGKPALLLLDALNESPCWKSLWRTYLAELVEDLQDYPWVRLGISVRESYLDRLLNGVPRDNIAQIYHPGFSGREYEATLSYFTHFKIEISAPPLTEEFTNPLFLKLYCEGLRKRGLRRPPEGMDGFSAILKFYVDSVNAVISDRLGIDEDRNLVWEAVKVLAKEMAVSEARTLPLSKARSLVEALHRVDRDENSLFAALIAEGVIAKDALPISREEKCAFDQILEPDLSEDWELVRFEFDRFTDHFIARSMIGKVPDETGSEKINAFVDTPAGRFLADHNAVRDNFSLAMALAIQVPEKLGLEIVEAVNCSDEHRRDLIWAVVGTLMWRRPASVSDRTRGLLEEMRTEFGVDGEVAVASILISVSCNPAHPLNAEYLHELLSQQNMPQRDAWWSAALHRRYIESTGALHRLLDWALHHSNAVGADDRVLLLWTTTLAWMLATSNRILRDRATKALVSLLDGRLDIAVSLVRQFIGVEDPYVRERIFAAVYGCTLRNRNVEAVRELAVLVHEKIFCEAEEPAHILIRDYARGIIEVALHLGVELPFNADEVRPPYGSPQAKPTMDRATLIENYDIDPPFDPKVERAPGYDIAWTWITHGDFARYQVDSLIGRFDEKSRTQTRSLYEECRCWMFLRILELGWTPDIFRAFDREVAQGRQYNRHETAKPETMTKKYAWIALHELAGHLADNELLNNYGSSPRRMMTGSWELGCRNIDPSVLLPGDDSGWDAQPYCWWFPKGVYDAWSADDTDLTWVQDTRSLPNVPNLLRAKDPAGVSWLLLDGTFDWDQPVGLPELDEDYQKRRKLYLIIQSYLVKKKDAPKVFTWLGEQNFFNRWMPEASSGMGEAFLGEFPWHPSTVDLDDERSDWTQGDSGPRVPKPILVTSHRYSWEQGYDGSLRKAGIYMHVPSRWIIKNMKVTWLFSSADEGHGHDPHEYARKGAEAVWFGTDGKPAALDPSLQQEGPSVLLVREDAVREFLTDNGYELLWTVLGEKQILGTRPDRSPGNLIINGAYRQARGNWTGKLRGQFEVWD